MPKPFLLPAWSGQKDLNRNQFTLYPFIRYSTIPLLLLTSFVRSLRLVRYAHAGTQPTHESEQAQIFGPYFKTCIVPTSFTDRYIIIHVTPGNAGGYYHSDPTGLILVHKFFWQIGDQLDDDLWLRSGKLISYDIQMEATLALTHIVVSIFPTGGTSVL